jgi:hypothetical protein
MAPAKGAQLNAYLFVLVYAVVCTAVIPVGFAVFKTPYQMLDVVLAAIGGAALSLIPTVGGVASLAGTAGILYWRMSRELLFPDILVSVLVARLTLLPVLLLLTHR